MRRLVRETLRLGGRELLIEAPAEGLEQLRRLYPHGWAAGGDGPPDLSLAVDGDGWRLRRGERTAGPLPGPLQAAIALEHEVESLLIRSCPDRVALHAGGIEAAGRAHLVAGGPDAGKSTSVLQLVELGHWLLCEEVALVDPATLAVHPHPRSLGLEARHLEAIARDRPLSRGAVDPLDAGLARYAPHRVRLEPAPLETLFLLRYRAGGGTRFAEVDPAEALPEILGHCFAPAVAQELLYERVIRILEGCRIVRVELDGVAAARRLWRRLLPPPGSG